MTHLHPDTIWWSGTFQTGVHIERTETGSRLIPATPADQQRPPAPPAAQAAPPGAQPQRQAASPVTEPQRSPGPAATEPQRLTEPPATEPQPSTEPPATELQRLPGTLLPGLTDAHVHLGLTDPGTLRAGGLAEVWDLGGSLAHLRSLTAPGPAVQAGRSHAAAEPAVRAVLPYSTPAIRFAGQFLTAPGGYPSDRAWAPPGSWREIHSPADAAEAVAEQAGASFIKVTLHTGGPTLDLPTVTAVASAARAAGLPLVVHAEGPGTVETALDAGADLLAHTPWTAPLDNGVLRAAAERMTWISTLDIHGYGTETPSLEIAVGNLRRFLSYGGTVRYGTDLGNGPLVPGINPREIRALQRAGLTPADILTAMTPSAATLPPTWIPGGLDLTPSRFADSLATARVADASVHPRPSGSP